MNVDLKKISQMNGGVQTDIGAKQGKIPASGGPSFAETLGKLQSPTAQAGLNPQAAQGLNSESVKFSNHAVERMMSRGIKFSPDDMNRLNDAVSRAQAKGSKDSLVLMNDTALIVSVKNKTVVTVMDKNALKDNVFTNIDSTIVM